MQPNKPVVLVVDDDPVNLDILVQTLEQDYFLIIAKNGKRALDLAFSHHPDLILLDILMPEMDGFEVCQRLKADKETEGIPVIFLSVMESPGQKHRGFEVGGVDYVTKPFHADEVLARVRTHITNKRLREELESHNMLIGMELHEKSRQLETLMNNLPGLPGIRRSISWGRTAWGCLPSSTRTTGRTSRKRWKTRSGRKSRSN